MAGTAAQRRAEPGCPGKEGAPRAGSYRHLPCWAETAEKAGTSSLPTLPKALDTSAGPSGLSSGHLQIPGCVASKADVTSGSPERS